MAPGAVDQPEVADWELDVFYGQSTPLRTRFFCEETSLYGSRRQG
jgi:hypothetical protein